MNFLVVNPLLSGGPRRRMRQPLSLAIIAAILRESGHNVDFIDCNIAHSNKINIDKDYQYLIVSTSPIDRWETPFLNYNGTLQVISQAIQKGIKAIVTGPHAIVSPEKIILEDEGIKAVILSEPEFVIKRLCENNFDFANTPSVAYRENQEVKFNEEIIPEKDLDLLPLPAFDLLPMDKYRYGLYEHVMPGPFSIVETSRGCPFNCVFCFKRPFGLGVRYRSVENVIKEIKELVNKYGVKSIYFQDLEFTINRPRVNEFCDALIKEKIKINWGCAGRVSDADDVLINKMSAAGCRVISFGVESLSDSILLNIRKQITKEQVRDALKVCKKNDVIFNPFLTRGHIGESKRTIVESLRYARKIGLMHPLNTGKIIPYPGTEVFKRSGIDPQNFEWYKLTERAGQVGVEENYDKLPLSAYYYYFTNFANISLIKGQILNFFSKYFHRLKQWLTEKNTRVDFNKFVSKYATSEKTIVIESHDCDYQKFFPNYVRIRDKDGEDVRYLVDDYYSLPFSDNSMTMVVATGILEHIDDPQRFIDEVYRVLKKDGTFLVTSSFIFPLHNTPKDYFHTTKYGLKRLLRNFSEVESFNSSNSMKGLSVIIHRIAYQSKMMWPFKVLMFLTAKIVPHFQFMIKQEYGDQQTDNKYVVDSIISANSFAKAKK